MKKRPYKTKLTKKQRVERARNAARVMLKNRAIREKQDSKEKREIAKLKKQVEELKKKGLLPLDEKSAS